MLASFWNHSTCPAALSSASATARSSSVIASPTAPLMPRPTWAGVLGIVHTARCVPSAAAIPSSEIPAAIDSTSVWPPTTGWISP